MAPPQSTGPHRCDLRPAQRPAYKMIAAGQLATVLAATSLTGCDPVFDLEGAFFPSWMLCLLIGIVLTALLRPLLARVGLEAYFGPPALIYSCLALLISFATWLTFFHT
jgi:hypothetical protein